MRVALALLFVMALALAGCAKPRAATQPDLPPLAPPAPPPRVVVPPVSSQPADAAKRPVRRPAPVRPEPPKPVTTPPVKEELPPTTLQATPPGGQAEVERQTRALLAQAARDLGRVKYDALNADGKAQFDTAKRFADQAQQALKEQNFAFALRLADKAATLAGGLVGR